jgi:hypothetical protein
MTLIEYLRTDKELIELRKEWKEKTDKPFPLFNNDEFGDISSYKSAIKDMLKNI